MSDIVISYARRDQPLAKELARHLQSLGFTLWWDIELLGSDDFTDVIQAEFSKARAIIVIWSETSVKSTFVRDEARFALQHGKLVATKISRLEVDRIPFGFQGQHTEDIANRDKIVQAVEKLGAARQAAKPTAAAAKSEELAAPPGTLRSYRRKSNLSALLSGLTLRLPDFLPIGSGRWAAIGLASTYILLSVGSFWFLSVTPESDAASVWVWLLIAAVVIVLAWTHFHKFIRQRLFIAGFIVAASATFIMLGFFVFLGPLTYQLIYGGDISSWSGRLPLLTLLTVVAVPIASLGYAVLRMWQAR